MKKIILLLAVLALSFGAFSCGGGGAGSISSPAGENPGVASVVQLTASHLIAQTNGSITLHAKVLDGNGVPLQGVAVTFTNLSEPFGVISAASGGTVAVTNGQGLATANLSSTTPGFATVVAQVNNGVGNVRDRKSFFFTPGDVLAVSMDLDVDSVPGNGVFNEISDFTLFETAFDDTVLVRATVRDAGGLRVAGTSVTWASDQTGDNVVFLAGTEHVTDVNGEARAVVKVQPASIRNTETHVNIGASAGNGAFNMVTLFLRPVVVAPSPVSSITADPSIVDTAGSSTVTAVVFLNTGATVPDGTIINFSTAPKDPAVDPSPCGTIDPFGATTGGIATAKFTAPLFPGICTVTGTVEGVVIGSTDITVISKLAVSPSSVTLPIADTPAQTFTITGGLPPYTVTTSDPVNAVVSGLTTTAPFTFTVTIGTAICTPTPITPPPAPPLPAVTPCTTTVTVTVQDALGSTATATINVINPRP